MFTCQICHITQPPRTPLNKVVVIQRPVIYFNPLKPDEVISKGWEIVRELMSCKGCAEDFNGDMVESKVSQTRKVATSSVRSVRRYLGLRLRKSSSEAED